MSQVQLKVVILGDQSVGKSSLILRFVSGNFKDEEDPTIGAAYLGKIVDYEDNAVKFNLWDTAGQERYHTLAKMYYRDADAAILVYDITRYSSFTGMKRWNEEVDNNGPKDILKLIIGNKEDLIDREEVPIDEAMSYADSVGAIYKKSSAKNNIGIESIFQIIASKKVAVGDMPDGGRRESVRIVKKGPSDKKKDGCKC